MVSWIFLVVGFGIGIIFGSLVDALASRTIKKKSFWGRSYCEKCKMTLHWYDLFPVFSYLLLSGKCRYCHKSIPKETILVEIVIGIIFALIFYLTLPQNLALFYGSNVIGVLVANYPAISTLLTLIFKIFIITILAIIFLVDLKTGLIPDRIVYPAVIITAVYLLLFYAYTSWVFYYNFSLSPLAPYLGPSHTAYLFDHLRNIWQPLLFSIISALGLALFFIALIVITRGRGMGGGDLKFAFLLGLALGFPENVTGIFLAFLLGSIIALVLIVIHRKSFGQTIPFGPFLSIGACLALLWGNQIIDWYIKFFSSGSILP